MALDDSEINHHSPPFSSTNESSLGQRRIATDKRANRAGRGATGRVDSARSSNLRSPGKPRRATFSDRFEFCPAFRVGSFVVEGVMAIIFVVEDDEDVRVLSSEHP